MKITEEMDGCSDGEHADLAEADVKDTVRWRQMIRSGDP